MNKGNELKQKILNEIATGTTPKECAEKYNIPSGTIRSWVNRSKAKGEVKPQRNAKKKPATKKKHNATQKVVEPKPVGRPTDYKIEYNDLAYKFCLLGATDAELGNFFEVTEQTINNWKNDYPDFFESIKRGKFIADANVADRLYQRAMGYEHDDMELKVVSLGNKKGSVVQQVEVTKYYPPDPTSAIFWMKNRRPKDWRDKQELEVKDTTNYADKYKAARERAKNAKKK